MNSNSKGEKGAADCGSFFLKSEKELNLNENATQIEFYINEETAKNGKKNFSINGKAVHSRFAPEREASGTKFAAKSVIAVFGLGAGYHIQNLMSANPESYCIVLEPLLPIFNRRKEFTSNLPDSRVFIFNSVQNEHVFPLLQKIMKCEFLRLETYSNICYKNLLPHLETEFYQIIRQHIGIIIQNILTESNFLPLWNKNILRNIAQTANVPFMQPVKKNISNKNIAVICAAGPTLDSQLPQIKQYREKLTIFATDTAFIPLTKFGITPDITVSLDGQYFTMGDFMCPITKNNFCIIDMLGYYTVANLFKNAAFTVSTYEKGTLADYVLQKLGITPLTVETGGTVTDYALDLARKLGFKTFFFAGYDLSYPKLVTHCKNAPSEQLRIATSDYFSSVEDLTLKSIYNRQFRETAAADGKKVMTDFVMDNYRNYLECYLESANDCAFFSASTESAKIAGVKYVMLEKLIKVFPESSRILPEKFNTQMQCADSNEIDRLFNEMTCGLYQYSQKLKTCIDSISEWTEKNTAVLRNLTEEILTSYPFLKQFLLMTQIILDRNHIIQNSPEYIRHVSFCLLQSVYFMIRELQKVQKRSINHSAKMEH